MRSDINGILLFKEKQSLNMSMFHCLRKGAMLLARHNTWKFNKNKLPKVQIIAGYLSNLVAGELSPVGRHYNNSISNSNPSLNCSEQSNI